MCRHVRRLELGFRSHSDRPWTSQAKCRTWRQTYSYPRAKPRKVLARRQKGQPKQNIRLCRSPLSLPLSPDLFQGNKYPNSPKSHRIAYVEKRSFATSLRLDPGPNVVATPVADRTPAISALPLQYAEHARRRRHCEAPISPHLVKISIKDRWSVFLCMEGRSRMS